MWAQWQSGWKQRIALQWTPQCLKNIWLHEQEDAEENISQMLAGRTFFYLERLCLTFNCTVWHCHHPLTINNWIKKDGLAEMHAYKWIIPISVGKKQKYLSVCGSHFTGEFSLFPQSSLFLWVVTCCHSNISMAWVLWHFLCSNIFGTVNQINFFLSIIM